MQRKAGDFLSAKRNYRIAIVLDEFWSPVKVQIP